MTMADARRHNVEVCVRIRPVQVKNMPSSFFQSQASSSGSTRTRTSGIQPRRNSLFKAKESRSRSPVDKTCAWGVISDTAVSQTKDVVQGRTHTYTLDKVYGAEVNTKEIFDRSMLPLVHSAMDGLNATFLAYGQTSTGKTHTITGSKESPGLTPLAVRECFSYLKRNEQNREYLIRVSCIEVYKEHIRDLLASSSTPPPVRLFDSADGLVIKGLNEEVVTSPEDVFTQLRHAEKRRQVGATHMNQHSSRSHVLVRILIESRDTASSTGGVRVSSLSLVDLAGSESVRLTGSSARREEGHYINKSLMTLGQVVHALADASENESSSKKHVPFRDSKLTRLLQPSLSGNAQVVLICCISPLLYHVEESHNTFKFATRAKKIPQNVVVKEITDEKTLLQGYRDEIEDLKKQLLEAKEQQAHFMTLTRGKHPTSMEQEGEATEDEINDLTQAIQTMEKLILKSNPSTGLATPTNPEDMLDIDNDLSDDEEENLMRLASTPRSKAATPVSTQARLTSPDKDLQNGLSHVQGLLGSVLRRRMQLETRAASNAATELEVRNLRKQLKEQEAASSLRQADSSFLQAQLKEKEALLVEVSKVLEAVEERQSRLEEENEGLRKELNLLKKHADLSSTRRAL